MSGRKYFKIVAVGDENIGKTSLLVTYKNKKFPRYHISQGLDSLQTSIVIKGKLLPMDLWDPDCSDEHSELRPLCYRGADCFLLCYSIGDPYSFERVKSTWYPEIRHFCPNVPIVLVGTKSDLRKQKTLDIVTTSEGKRLQKKIKASEFVECSALTQDGFEKVFVKCLEAINASKSSCSLL